MEQIQASDPSHMGHPSAGRSGAPTAQPVRGETPAADAVPASMSASWAQHLDQVREAQRLRYAVFAGEMCACLRCAPAWSNWGAAACIRNTAMAASS